MHNRVNLHIYVMLTDDLYMPLSACVSYMHTNDSSLQSRVRLSCTSPASFNNKLFNTLITLLVHNCWKRNLKIWHQYTKYTYNSLLSPRSRKAKAWPATHPKQKFIQVPQQHCLIVAAWHAGQVFVSASSLLYQWFTHGSHPKISLQHFVMITGGRTMSNLVSVCSHLVVGSKSWPLSVFADYSKQLTARTLPKRKKKVIVKWISKPT